MEKYFDTRLNQDFRKGASDIWRLVAADLLKKIPAKCDRVLDLGAGYGDFINQVNAPEKWAADLWPGLERNITNDVRAVIGDITTPIDTLPQNHFDLCFMSNVLEHFTIDDAQKILDHTTSYLKKDGYIALLQPNFKYCSKVYYDDYTHKTIFTAEGLCNFLLDNDYEILSCQPRYLPYSFKSRLPRPLWAVKLYLQSPWKPLAAQMLILARKNEKSVYAE